MNHAAQFDPVPKNMSVEQTIEILNSDLQSMYKQIIELNAESEYLKKQVKS